MDGNQTFRVEYDVMTADDMVVVEIASGRWWKVAKSPRPTRQRIWRFTSLRRNRWHCAYPLTPRHHLAQAGLDLPAWGTTHADYFYGPSPARDR